MSTSGLKMRHGQYTFALPKARRTRKLQAIGKYDAGTGTWDGVITKPYGYSSWCFLLLAILFIGALLTVILVPTLVGKDHEKRDMTLPSTTTSANTTTTTQVTNTTESTTTFSGGPPLETTPPLVPLVIQCPEIAEIPLGKDWLDLNETGQPVITGGCDPDMLNVTFVDQVTGTVSKRGTQFVSKTQVRSGATLYNMTGVVIEVDAIPLNEHHALKQSVFASLKHESNARSPTFPQSKLVASNVADVSQEGGEAPDVMLDVGLTEVVHAMNMRNGTVRTGTHIHIFDKAMNILSEFELATQMNVPSGPCQQGAGEPQVLFDHLANKWLLLERASVNDTLCLYVSIPAQATSVATNYLFYEIPLPFGFPARLAPQLSMFNDYYTLAVNVDGVGPGGPPMIFIERGPIVSQAASTRVLVSRGFPSLSGFAFQHMSPVNVENGSPQPSFPGAIFMRLNDDELHTGSPNAAEDYLDVVQFIIIDFDSSTLVFQFYDIAIQEFDSSDTGCTSPMACVNTITGQRLNANQRVLNGRVQYRNLVDCPGQVERITGAFATAVGSVQSRVRWFQLQYNANTAQFEVYQDAELDYGDALSRWMPSTTMDRYGNAAIIYNVASTVDVIPSLRATSRAQTDPLGMMRTELDWGTGIGQPTPGPVSPNNAWGNMMMLAADGSVTEGRTFYGTGQFYVFEEAFVVRAARLRQGGDYLERTWIVEDAVCQQVEQCTQIIQIG